MHEERQIHSVICLKVYPSIASMFPLSVQPFFLSSARGWRVCFPTTGAAHLTRARTRSLSSSQSPLAPPPPPHPSLLSFPSFLCLSLCNGVGAERRKGCLRRLAVFQHRVNEQPYKTDTFFERLQPMDISLSHSHIHSAVRWKTARRMRNNLWFIQPII